MSARKEQSLPEVNNPKAGRDYFIGQTFEAGLVLLGTEVKSLRLGRANIADSFVRLTPKGPVLFHAHIAEYDFGNHNNHDPYRTRKLLLKAVEVARITEEVRSGGSKWVVFAQY